MTLKIYNSLTRKKEEFIPIEEGIVKMYVCGMTVYSDAHIGHARTYFAFDVIRRYLKYTGFDVKYIQNITDVDDKIIAAANKENVDALEYSRHFADRCLGDLDKLGIKRADFYPKASETITDMIKMIERIIANGYGYESRGDVYFSVEKFKKYGKLSGQNINELSRGKSNKPNDGKYNNIDFALWKKAKINEPFWESPWGKGRPGWHIECSAMSGKYLGLPFDIHGGGMDLRFPHHENEIAQAEASSGTMFAKYWIHIGLLTVDGEKMSKSIGNIINIKDLLKEWNPEIIRFFFAQAHYRSPPDFSKIALQNADKGLTRIYRLKEKLHEKSQDSNDEVDSLKLTNDEKIFYRHINDFEKNFVKNMDDDFNTPGAVAEIFEFVNNSNKFLKENPDPDKKLCARGFKTLLKLGNILTIFQDKEFSDDELIIGNLKDLLRKYDVNSEFAMVDELIEQLLLLRNEARKDKNWTLSDSIRDELDIIGFEIQDTDKGTIWRRK